MIGCYKARTVPVNLNFRYVAPELRYVVDNADLEALVFERALSPLVAEALPAGPGTTATPSATASPCPTFVVVEDGTDPSVDVDRPVVHYEAALAGGRPGARVRTRGRPTTSTSSTPGGPPGCPRA